VSERLVAELDTGESEDYLTATVNEILRRRPVLPNAEPRLVIKPIEVGGVSYQPGVMLMPSSDLLHHGPQHLPQPLRLPARALPQGGAGHVHVDPFGGGRRRCIGASFAVLEMKIVLRAVLSRYVLTPPAAAHERARRRSITVSPEQGCTLTLTDRTPRPEPLQPSQQLSAAA